MQSIFLKRKLEQSYSTLNKEIQEKVFPYGKQEYIYVGTALSGLFKKQDVFKLIQIYASVYTYYQLEMGNSYKTFNYAKKKAAGILSDYDCKTLMGLVMVNVTSDKTGISDPIAKIDEYRRYINSYLNTVEKIRKHQLHFATKALEAGTINSPILVDGVGGVHKYIESLKIAGIDKISFKRTSAQYLSDQAYGVDYAIDEYTLINASNGTEIASIWFNIYGTENTEVQPVCFSDKTPFTVTEVATEVFELAKIQLQSVEEICRDLQVEYDKKKFVIATLVYFYIVWVFNFKNIRMGQAMNLKESYIEKFALYNRERFTGLPDKQLSDNEQVFEKMLKSVDDRVRNSYQKNNFTFVNEGLVDEYLFEFVLNKESISRIYEIIEVKMMKEWAGLGDDADQKYLT